MNKQLFSLFLLIILACTGCRKGEEDPVISLRTREMRLKNTWDLISSESTVSEEYGLSATNKVITAQYDGEKEIISENAGGTYTYDTLWYTKEYIFRKGKSYTMKYIQTDPDVPSFRYEMNEKGRWEFLSRSKSRDVKNKEQLLLIPELQQDDMQDAAIDFPHITWNIVRLANNELVIEIRKEISNTLSGYSYNEVTMMNFEGR